jgi:hypothetical protein
MNTKKAVLAIVIVFLGFWMFTDSHGLADAGRAGGEQTWSLTTQLFGAVIDFIREFA